MCHHFSDFPDPTPTSISPHSLLQETSAIRISIHEECGLPKVQPKTRRRIIGVPSDMLLDVPKRVIKPSRMVKSPFLCKQYQCVRLDVQAQEDLFTYTNSISAADQLRLVLFVLLFIHVRSIITHCDYCYSFSTEKFGYTYLIQSQGF